MLQNARVGKNRCLPVWRTHSLNKKKIKKILISDNLTCNTCNLKILKNKKRGKINEECF